MSHKEQEHGPATRRQSRNLGSAVAYYGLVGLAGAALAAWFVISTVETLLGGYCDPGAEFLCHYVSDLIAPTIAFVVGLTLLPTARQLRRNPPELGPLVGVGVVVGVVVALLPIILILWAADFSGEFNVFGSKVPTLGLVLLFSAPLLWAVASAVIVWRQGVRQGERRALVTGLGGGALIVAAGAMVAVNATAGIGGVGDMPQDAGETMRESVGTATLRLERPIEHVETGGAECFAGAGDHLSVQLEAARLPIEGQPLINVAVTAERDELYVYITVEEPETGRYHDMGSSPGSITDARRDGASGSFRFANLDGTSSDPNGEPGPLDLDLEGTIEWTCGS